MIKHITEHYCDRCGEQFDPHKKPKIRIDHGAHEFHNFLSSVSQPIENIWLCPECSEDAVAWWYSTPVKNPPL